MGPGGELQRNWCRGSPHSECTPYLSFHTHEPVLIARGWVVRSDSGDDVD
jgi:hypothetical protein